MASTLNYLEKNPQTEECNPHVDISNAPKIYSSASKESLQFKERSKQNDGPIQLPIEIIQEQTTDQIGRIISQANILKEQGLTTSDINDRSKIYVSDDGKMTIIPSFSETVGYSSIQLSLNNGETLIRILGATDDRQQIGFARVSSEGKLLACSPQFNRESLDFYLKKANEILSERVRD
jgi:hypothetical protein